MHKKFFQLIFAHSPVGMTIYDSAGDCVEANEAICKIIGASREQVLAQNFHHIQSWMEHGMTTAALEALSAGTATRKRVTLTSTFGKPLTANANFVPIDVDGERHLLFTLDDLTEVKKVEDEREKLIEELQAALREVATLRAFLPVCAYCKKVRDDEGYWEQVDVYMRTHLKATVTHSICPGCAEEHFPDDV